MSNIFYLASKNKYLVNGLNLENFLFALTSSGISVTKIKRKKQMLTFVSSSVNNNFIVESANNLGLSIKILGQTGLINFIKKLPYQIGAIFGIIFSVLCVMHFTGYINTIEYIIPQNHTCVNKSDCIYNKENLQQIENFIAQYIKVGTKYSADTKAIQNMVMANFNLVENCSIIKNGSTIKIELIEAVGKLHGLNKQIVAQNNCIITSISTFSGKALVKAGDVVKKGQVLVDSIGDILPRADIIAKVWYTGMAIHNSNQILLKETQNTFITTGIQIFGKDILKAKPTDFEYYKATKTTRYISDFLLPIKKVTYTYKQLQFVEEYVAFESVKQTVMQQSKQNALSKTSGSPIECTYSIVKQSNITRVDCYLLVEEQLGTV